jgi:hypothetical protein
VRSLGPSRTGVFARDDRVATGVRPVRAHARAFSTAQRCKSGRGLPHSQKLAPSFTARNSRSVLECARPLALSVVRDRRRFVTAAQNRVVQIGRVGFSGIKRYNYPLTFCIYPNVAHPRDAHERFSQFSDAFITILAFRRDCDSLQHRFLCALQVMWVGGIEMMWIEWFDHPPLYLSRRAAPVGSAGLWYEPDWHATRDNEL